MGLEPRRAVAPDKVESEQRAAEAIRSTGSRLEMGGGIGGPGRTRATTAFPLLRSGHSAPLGPVPRAIPSDDDVNDQDDD